MQKTATKPFYSWRSSRKLKNINKQMNKQEQNMNCFQYLNEILENKPIDQCRFKIDSKFFKLYLRGQNHNENEQQKTKEQKSNMKTFFSYQNSQVNQKKIQNPQSLQEQNRSTIFSSNKKYTNQLHVKPRQSDQNVEKHNLNQNRNIQIPSNNKQAKYNYFYQKNQRTIKIDNQIQVTRKKELPPSSQNKKRIIEQQSQIQSSYYQEIISANSQYIKSKIPKQILRYIKRKAKQQLEKDQLNQKNLQLSQQNLSSNIIKPRRRNQARPSQTCQICEIKSPSEYFFNITGNCSHRFCSSCLYGYINHRISNFQKVLCPSLQCQCCLDTNIGFYKQFNTSVRNKYKKFLLYEKVINNNNLRLCPGPQCDGIIDRNNGLQCGQCYTYYCDKCNLQKHQNNCQERELEMFKNFQFSRCPQCNIIIQKIAGCNHIKCICEYQFCYRCTGKWSLIHQCPKPNPTFRQKCQQSVRTLADRFRQQSIVRAILISIQRHQNRFNESGENMHNFLCFHQIDFSSEVIQNKILRRFWHILLWIPTIVILIPLLVLIMAIFWLILCMITCGGCCIDIFIFNYKKSKDAPISLLSLFILYPVFTPFIFTLNFAGSLRYFVLKMYLTISRICY